MENFEFSENLRKKVEKALVNRIADAWQHKENVEDFIRHGWEGIDELNCNDLMDEYMNWHGAYSLQECPDDYLLRQMFEEADAYKFEQEVLLKKEV